MILTEQEEKLFPTPKKSNKKLLTVISYITTIVLAVTLALCIQNFLISPITISGESMQNTLEDSQRIFLLKAGYKLDYGDIVVFNRPNGNKPPIKRIIAKGGDTIQITHGIVYLNDVKLTENYTKGEMDGLAQKNNTARITLKADEFFVMGDNRNDSMDSRDYGAIKADWIIGKALFKQPKYDVLYG